MSVLIWHPQLPQQQLGDFWIPWFHSGGQRLLKFQQLMTAGKQLCLQHWSHKSKIEKTNPKFLRLGVKTLQTQNQPTTQKLLETLIHFLRPGHSSVLFLNLHTVWVSTWTYELFYSGQTKLFPSQQVCRERKAMISACYSTFLFSSHSLWTLPRSKNHWNKCHLIQIYQQSLDQKEKDGDIFSSTHVRKLNKLRYFSNSPKAKVTETKTCSFISCTQGCIHVTISLLLCVKTRS